MQVICEEGSLPAAIQIAPSPKHKSELQPLQISQRKFVFEVKSDQNEKAIFKETQEYSVAREGTTRYPNDRFKQIVHNEDQNQDIMSEDHENSKLGVESGGEENQNEDDMKDIVMKQQVDIFLFVNPRSGARMGQKFLDLNFQKVQFELEKGYEVHFHIIDLTNVEKKRKALKEMKHIQKRIINKPSTQSVTSPQGAKGSLIIPAQFGLHKRLIMAVAGGDGTPMYMAQDAVNEGVNMEEVSICALPYGTGNDLSQILGWGKQPKEKWSQQIQELAKLIVNAQEENFNVWQISVHLREEGGDIFQWDSKSRQKKSKETKVYERLMCNYFSIGLESRVGLGFEKKRTTKVCCNKCVYFLEGIKKICCLKRTRKIRDIIDSFCFVDQEGKEQTIFSTDPKTPNEKTLRGNPLSLLCTNVNSIYGGQSNLWASGKNMNPGLVDHQGQNLPRESFKFKDQSTHDDDHLEFETFSSVMHMVLAKGRRVAQEKGPFIIKYKEPKSSRHPLISYFQIDGEFYKMVNAERVEIKLSDQLGHLKVLKNIADD